MPAPTDFIKIIRDLRRDVDALKRRSPLANSGLSVTDEGVVTVDGNLVVEGDFTAQGKIDNTALVSPVLTDSEWATGGNFAVTTTGSTPLATKVVPVPSGFTRCGVFAAARVFAVNNTASLDYLRARPRIFIGSSQTNGGVGQGVPLAVSANGGSGLNTGFLGVQIENLAEGDTLTLYAEAWTQQAGWAANAANYAEVTAMLVWTR